MNQSLNLFKELIVLFGPGIGASIPIAFLCIVFWDKIEGLLTFIFFLLKNCFIFADKQYTKRDLQGRMNNFVKRLDKKMHSFDSVKMKINFSAETDDIEGFNSGGKYIIKVKKNIDPNNNFVNVAMFFLSRYLLLKAKKQISPKQQESIDLFVANKLFQEEKDSVMSQFLDMFLHPRTKDDRIRDFYDKYTNLDNAGLFFPIFLQEMTFLGDRVFSNPKNRKIEEEVKLLIDFLNNYSQRKITEEIESTFEGEFSKFAIAIVGKPDRVINEGPTPYTKYIKILIEKKVESIYLVGDEKNKNFIIDLGKTTEKTDDSYEIFKQEKYKAILKVREEEITQISFLLTLRKKNPNPFIQT